VKTVFDRLYPQTYALIVSVLMKVVFDRRTHIHGACLPSYINTSAMWTGDLSKHIGIGVLLSDQPVQLQHGNPRYSVRHRDDIVGRSRYHRDRSRSSVVVLAARSIAGQSK